jgi:uncharacterized membrane-anchored protein
MFMLMSGRLMRFLILILVVSPGVRAEPDATRNPLRAAFEAAGAELQKGPLNVPIAKQAVLLLPGAYNFVGAESSRNLLEAMGNPGSDNVQGMIFPAGDDAAQWFIVVTFNPVGYIRDHDARSWKPDDVLAEIRKGTEAANGERRDRGLPELDVAGWVEPPQYDPDTHHLLWSLSSRLKGQAPETVSGINYNSVILGRDGYISMNLVTDSAAIEPLKPVARKLLASLAFDAGKRYDDFQAETDKVAEYGLMALVAGVAAKKLGLLAMAGLFLAKFAKIIMAAAVLGLAGLVRIFGKKTS